MITVQSALAYQQTEERLPEPGRYRHFKGGEYVLISVARHSETEELHAVYRPADAETVWVRPLAMFMEPVVLGDTPVPRFQRVR